MTEDIRPEDLPPEVTRRYADLRLLGKGGMGQVYRATDIVLQIVVALKFIRPDAAADERFARRFAREVQALVRLSHPNVVRLLDYHEAGALRYYAMEFVEGSTLEQLVAARSTSGRAAVALVAQVAAGLAAAHEAGLVHRDLKPANVVVDRKGAAKLVDFGLVRFDLAEAATKLTAVGGFVGTLRYISPEVMRGEEATRASDVYQLGLVLYEAVTGKHAFGGASVPDIASGVAFRRILEPASLVPPVDPALSDVIMNALALNPEVRPTAAELHLQLREWLDSPAAGASGARTTEPGSRPRRSSGDPDQDPTVPPCEQPRAPGRLTPTVALLAVFFAALGLYAPYAAYQWALRLADQLAVRSEPAPTAPPRPRATPAPEATPTPGFLSLDVEPADAEVLVNGRPVPVAEWYACPVAPGPWRLEVRSPGYAPEARSGRATAGGTERLLVRLAPRRGSRPAGERTTTPSGLSLVYCPPGLFDMGCQASEVGSFEWERPPRRVSIERGYWIGAFEVTLGQWTRVMRDTPAFKAWLLDYRTWNFPSSPADEWLRSSRLAVNLATFEDATAFCEKLSALEGARYRLPTEAEWEYAARAGSGDARYGKLEDVAFWEGQRVGEVGRKAPNAWGLFDTLGNVWEWASDCSGAWPVSNEARAMAERGETPRIFRGGGAWGDPRYCRAASRSAGRGGQRSGLVGFRVVRDE